MAQATCHPPASVKAAAFIYGVAVHLLFVRAVGFLFDTPTANWRHEHAVVLNATVGFLGGAFVAMLIPRLLTRPAAGALSSFPTALRGGVLGMAATVLTVESFYVLCAGYLGARAAVQYPNPGFGLAGLLLGFVSINTYGFPVVLLAVPFGLAYGAVAGAVASWIGRAR